MDVLAHRHIAGEEWEVDVLQFTATLLGAVGSRSHLVHSPAAMEQWAVDLVKYPAKPLGSSGRWIFFNTQPQCWEAVDSETPFCTLPHC